MPVEGAENPRT